jgi:hypothetical protein
MLDSECRERTEMAESERRGVLIGGWTERGGPSGDPVLGLSSREDRAKPYGEVKSVELLGLVG